MMMSIMLHNSILQDTTIPDVQDFIEYWTQMKTIEGGGGWRIHNVA